MLHKHQADKREGRGGADMERQQLLTCDKCGKKLEFGIDGSCKNCGAQICWECWVAAGYECPICYNFAGMVTGWIETNR